MLRSPLRPLLCLLLGTAGFGCAGASRSGLSPSGGSSRWERQVRDQLRQRSSFLTSRGFDLTSEVFNGSLDDDEAENLTVTLRSGVQYAFLGVCDNDCRDIDLRLYDEDGDLVDSDVRTDDWPIVQVTPSRTAEYRVRVIMANCSVSPCFYGVGLYSK